MRDAEFAAALLDPERPVPKGISDPEGRPAIKRFAVYRNNVTQGLGAALEAGFPAVLALVGVEFFRGMALEFLRKHPPQHRIMMLYGAEFPDFIAGFKPAQSIGYLADVARLEQALRDSYHAADAVPVAHSVIAAMDEAAWATARLGFAPSLRLMRSRWPVHSIYAASLGKGAPPQMQAEEVMISRPDFDTTSEVLPQGSVDFIGALLQGRTITEALGAAPAGFDPGPTLGRLITTNAVTEINW